MSDQAPSPASPEQRPAHVPGMAQVRIDIARMRNLIVVVLLLVVLALVGMGAWIITLQSQINTLTARAAAVPVPVAAPSTPAPSTPAPTAPAAAAPDQASPAATSAAAPLASEVVMPSGVDEAGAFVLGDPKATDIIEVYVDYQCPFCQRWEAQVGGDLVERAMQPNSGLQVRQYNLAFLGETSKDLTPAGASARAASAAACVMDGEGADTFARFTTELFTAADPSEPPGQFTADVLRDLATSAGASEATLACIDSEEFVPFVAASTQSGFGRGVNGTPTVYVNGIELENPFEDARLDALLVAPVAS